VLVVGDSVHRAQNNRLQAAVLGPLTSNPPDICRRWGIIIIASIIVQTLYHVTH